MTRVVFERDKNTFSLTCSGHAGYGEKGKDIVCAGISALCGALEIALDNLQNTGAVQTHFCSWSNASFCAQATAAPVDAGVETAFELVYNGLCRMQEEYSAYLECHRCTDGDDGMKNVYLQFFAEGAAEAAANGEAAESLPAEESTSAAEAQEPAPAQPEEAEQPQDSALPDLQTLQQLQRIADGRMRMQDWQAQGEQLKAFYPSFSFSELYNGNADFARLLQAGVSVRHAYEVTHLPQILTAAMQYAARKAAEKTASAMYGTAVRPQENGLSDRKAGLPTEKKVDNLTQTDIIRILERVGKGDKITF